jgi:hypothetical protein
MERTTPARLVKRWRHIVARDNVQCTSFIEIEVAEFGLAEPRPFPSMASKTGDSSPGVLEITPSTSAVAVCCSSASESSRVRCCSASNSRTFSIAITA